MGDAAREKRFHLRGLEKLGAAILAQAIQDIRRHGNRTASETLRWIQDGDEKESSFPFWCRVAGLDPERLRRAVLAGNGEPARVGLGWAHPPRGRPPRLRRQAAATFFQRGLAS